MCDSLIFILTDAYSGWSRVSNKIFLAQTAWNLKEIYWKEMDIMVCKVQWHIYAPVQFVPQLMHKWFLLHFYEH